MHRVLVTGANGFIGQHLVKSLINNGFNVNVLVRDRRKISFDNVNIYEGNIYDSNLLRQALRGVDVVFHLVAKTHDLSNSADVNDYFKINVEGTRALLDCCIDSKVKHFVYFSSVKTMAEESKDALDETFIPRPTTPYGESKLQAEKLVIKYGEKYNFKTTLLRFPLIYGPGNKGNIYRMIKAIDRGHFVTIGRGENKRSMVYVGNAIDATLAVVQRQKMNTKAYIVTDGIDYTVRELYEITAKKLGKKSRTFFIPLKVANKVARIGDIGQKIIKKSLPFNSDFLNKLSGSYIFSSQKIQEEIGFKPRYNFYNSIDETINWYKDKSYF